MVIISGYSCTGKSKIGNLIEKNFGFARIKRDLLKEHLYDSLPSISSTNSLDYDKASYKLLYRFAGELCKTGKPFILESNFVGEPDTSKINGLADESEYSLLQIFCYAEPNIILERFKKRAVSGERHSGHNDKESFEYLENFLHGLKQKPLNLKGELIKLETSDFKKVNYEIIISKVEELLIKLSNN
jgi:predicted kinase